jgi:hypothetical protein
MVDTERGWGRGKERASAGASARESGVWAVDVCDHHVSQLSLSSMLLNVERNDSLWRELEYDILLITPAKEGHTYATIFFHCEAIIPITLD